MSTVLPDTPLTELPRITGTRAKALHEAGLMTVQDLLKHYPRRYEDRRKFPGYPQEGSAEPVCLRGKVVVTKMARFGRRCQFTLTLEALPELPGPSTVLCRWFNLRYLSNILQAGQDLIIFGRPRALKKGGVVFDHPDFEVLETEAPDSALIHLNRIVPVHPSIGPWSPRMLRRLVFETLGQLEERGISTLWPGAKKDEEFSAGRAIRSVHFPETWDDLEKARSLLARDELFEMQCVLARQRQRQTGGSAPVIERRSTLLSRFVKQLPFEFTGAQKRVLTRIFDDLSSGHPMNRLLHGDVGSGKTVVAAAAIVGTVAAGHTAALMAPTQILAQQHYETLCQQLEPLGIRVTLRTGARKTSNHADVPHVIVGTHALLFAPQAVGHPALVVIDEQHKFGVRQRARLADQTPHPHVLVMSATPIPRTLALTLYGDLDLSLLDEMPPGRQAVRTLVRPHAKLGEAAAFVRSHLDRGRQAYLVYPVIDEGVRKDVKAATLEHARWSSLLSPHLCLLLHGRLEAGEKDAVMRSFRDGEARAIICTTVIEVGIDVANAAILLVENAERFGLAQLHQLRGRVGRGHEKSWCILLTGSEADDRLDRLKILETASDGFSIAEADLALRGPGDLLGTEQTGLPPVRLAKLPQDLPLLKEARTAAQAVLASDPTLASHPLLQSRLAVWEKQLFAGVA
jgi:ATP-dependent DNA helicase RecG